MHYLSLDRAINWDLFLHDDGFGQLLIKGVSSVFDRHGTAASATGYYGDRLTAVTAQRKQKCVQLLVIGIDTGDNIFLTLLGSRQIHDPHLMCLKYRHFCHIASS